MLDPAWDDEKIKAYIIEMPCFSGEKHIRPLIGGLCNTNFVVTDSSAIHVVRVGGDIQVHGIMQSSVQNAMRAASELEVTPYLLHAEPGVVVSRYIEGRALVADDLADQAILRGWVARLKELHTGTAALSGAVAHFDAFQVSRQYLRFCIARGRDDLDRFLPVVEKLAARIAPYLPVLTHNDVVPQNAMLDTEGRVHLVDWDYGGYGHPWFDVAGLATNADATPEQEEQVIALYAGEVTGELRALFRLFKVAVNLREYLWGIVQDLSSVLDVEIVSAGMAELYPDETPGYSGYAEMNLRRLEASLEDYRRHHP